MQTTQRYESENVPESRSPYFQTESIDESNNNSKKIEDGEFTFALCYTRKLGTLRNGYYRYITYALRIIDIVR